MFLILSLDDDKLVTKFKAGDEGHAAWPELLYDRLRTIFQ
jgi:hypothetical protein